MVCAVERRAVPYRFFALSNAGSMLALLTYPVLVEPRFSTRRQAWGWSAGYLGFVVLCGAGWMSRASRIGGTARTDEIRAGDGDGPAGRCN